MASAGLIVPRRRLHVDAALAPDTSLTLDAERSHYLCRVLRQRRGDHVLLFAGDGNGYDARIDDANPRGCYVTLGAVVESESAVRSRLHLGQALIKGERLDFVVQKATELGVTDIWLIESQRAEVHVAESRISRRDAHWKRIVESAAEQCGRLRLPTVHAPVALTALLDTRPATQMFLLDPGAPPIEPPRVADTLLLVGPEGGFTEGEREAARATGARPMGLGRLILRADTAPLAALAILRQSWGWIAP